MMLKCIFFLSSILQAVAMAKLSSECFKTSGFMNGLISKAERDSEDFRTDMSFLEEHLLPEMSLAGITYRIDKVASSSYFSLT
mmetsp:Transcript_10643/g.13173  ORF Transcript_10643/g.13173 Transcript_10643/m.13173 type:complete len:83 (+) Transcript_10643:25-273(+)|eukprot:CAMPEP_0170457834 /NCGR_PEP_ID=MMETSP0123-20130129/4988_1 /TAXON_ID=182087 /ORGANISM="Favella ehrenbergii, Strain Fehren 1" /LENGTH=82 /DNA_ID=CAMNT_0010721747 /DNA_START=25 /DNA_END=273 /DNA_ORIENTATION=-